MLHKTSSKLSEPDMRDKNFETQVESILSSIGVLQGDRQSIIAKSKSQQEKMKDMEKEITSLEGVTREEQAEKGAIGTRKKSHKRASGSREAV